MPSFHVYFRPHPPFIACHGKEALWSEIIKINLLSRLVVGRESLGRRVYLMNLFIGMDRANLGILIVICF